MIQAKSFFFLILSLIISFTNIANSHAADIMGGFVGASYLTPRTISSNSTYTDGIKGNGFTAEAGLHINRFVLISALYDKVSYDEKTLTLPLGIMAKLKVKEAQTGFIVRYYFISVLGIKGALLRTNIKTTLTDFNSGGALSGYTATGSVTYFGYGGGLTARVPLGAFDIYADYTIANYTSIFSTRSLEAGLRFIF